MIFVTVGHQMPFDRLVQAVDDWAGSRGCPDVFAQIGSTKFRPKYLRFAEKVDPLEFRRYMVEADSVVAHAGMGTILTALELGKPILVLPRQGRLMETRNDHQVATAERFKELGRVSVAMNEAELPLLLDRLASMECSQAINSFASVGLLNAVRGFIHGTEKPN